MEYQGDMKKLIRALIFDRVGIGLTICLFMLFMAKGIAQPLSDLPRLYPSYVNHFAEDGLSYSNVCFSDAVLDVDGRLWLNVCAQQRYINNIGLFQFDGYQFQPVELESPDGRILGMPALKGVMDSGQLFGIARYENFFFLDPKTRDLQVVPFADKVSQAIRLSGFSKVGSTIYLMGHSSEDHQLLLFKNENKTLKRVLALDYSEGVWGPKCYPLVADTTEFWLMGGTFPLFRVDRKTGQTRRYGLKDLINTGPIEKPNITLLADQFPVLHKKPDGTVYLYLPDFYGNHFFVFDRKLDRFVSMRDQFPPDWVPKHLFEDQSGGVCFLFEDNDGQYRAIVEDASGQRYDYSGIVRSFSDIKKLMATDFREQVYAVGQEGLYTVGIREEESIQQIMPGRWISAMAALPDGRVLVNTVRDGWFVYDEDGKEASPFIGPDCGLEPRIFARGMKQQLIPDEEGHIWMAAQNYLLKYSPVSQSCEAYELSMGAKLFCFLSKQLVAIQFEEQELGFYNLKTREEVEMSSAIPRNLNSFIRDLFMDSEGLLWVLTNEGLWQIDVDKKQSRQFTKSDGFADHRFTAIYEDDKGRLWLGTYYGGLHIFDQRTREITVVDQEDGLSNNAVMSILPDDEGNLWVGTEYGINIISQEGEVLNSLFLQDGLSYEVFERFDPLKMPDGRLYFGSRNGITLINPEQVKTVFNEGSEVKIYLTALTYFDEEEGQEITFRKGLQSSEPIRIPAEHSGIHIKFGLSSFLEPQKNRYAYKLEGKDKDWHYLGNQPELHISRLPAGEYNLLVKGADFRGNWTDEPVVIPIRAEEFFYKQAWFYLLLAAPFLLIALAWARNKQLEARRLEQEVARRTRKIETDKEVIAQQAEELQQLDAAKTRFFTNISHELRTPVTLIKTPLENLLQKYSASFRSPVRGSLQVVLRNASKLGKLVEELLELSRLDAQKASLNEKPVSLATFCRQLFSSYASSAEMKQLRYTFDTDLPEGASYLIDPNRLEKILDNLLSNALKFTPTDGTVLLRVRHLGEELLFEVQDDGFGIPAADLPRIFDRFYQAQKQDATMSGGTGIGLALSRELALLMQGDITVSSEVGKGTLFQLRLPARLVEKETVVAEPDFILEERVDRQVVAEQFNRSSNGEHSNQPRLLIVEDNPDMQQLLHTLLADDYDCQIASNGAEAWKWLSTDDPAVKDIDLMVSDVMMPEMDGYTLLEHVKAHPDWQQLPVIMLTARAAEEDKLQALRMGVDDYLLKPFSSNELEARVRNLIANYRVRKSLRETKQDQLIDIVFEHQPSAGQVWLGQLEEAAKLALDKRLKLNVSYLANKMCLSERQFSRKLRTFSGLSPSEYIQEVKLQKARHLLENQSFTTVNEVAAECGYSSGSYLTKVFQERFGKTPSDYFL
jgi:signal transduction histidine kinase/DNA-binding response OmpR family regulator